MIDQIGVYIIRTTEMNRTPSYEYFYDSFFVYRWQSFFPGKQPIGIRLSYLRYDQFS